MKKVLVTVIMILLAACVYGQIEMPKELTCTERAFNLSFSLGTKWKISAPKMGPAEVTTEELAYTPAWSLKLNEPQTYTAEAYHPTFNLMDKPQFVLPGVKFVRPVNFKLLKPGFLGNPVRYAQ